jgi:hypothetical protein
VNAEGVSTTINILVIDVATNYNIALEALNDLINNEGESLGRVPVNAVQVASSVRGL